MSIAMDRGLDQGDGKQQSTVGSGTDPWRITQAGSSRLQADDSEVHVRATFIATHGYRPEDSTTPYVPVTIDGPQDHHAYYAKEYP